MNADDRKALADLCRRYGRRHVIACLPKTMGAKHLQRHWQNVSLVRRIDGAGKKRGSFKGAINDAVKAERYGKNPNTIQRRYFAERDEVRAFIKRRTDHALKAAAQTDTEE